MSRSISIVSEGLILKDAGTYDRAEETELKAEDAALETDEAAADEVEVTAAAEDSMAEEVAAAELNKRLSAGDI